MMRICRMRAEWMAILCSIIVIIILLLLMKMNVAFAVTDNNLTVEAVGETTIYIQPNTSTELSVSASCDSGSIYYTWYYYKHDGNRSTRVYISGANNSTFQTEVISKDSPYRRSYSSLDGYVEEFYNVYCCVEDDYGNSRYAEFYIVLENGLKAKALGNTSISVPLNSTPQLSVTASCNVGSLYYTWKRRDEGYYELLENEMSDTIELPPVEKTIEYLCEVTDEFGNREYIYFNVSVDNNLSVSAVGDTVLKARANSTPMIAVNADCQTGSIKYTWRQVYPVSQEIINENAATLKLQPVIENARYCCEVSDEYGNKADVYFMVYIDDGITTVEEKIKAIVNSEITSGMSDYDKALALHDWLVRNAEYDWNRKNYGPDGVLIYRTGVCQSYASAYKLLLDEVGIPNDLEHGDDHVWNMIQLDGDWYHVDVTWDEAHGSFDVKHTYFCVSNYFLEKERNHECYNKPHIATSYKYNYDYYNGLLSEKIQDAHDIIDKRITNNESHFSFLPTTFGYSNNDRTVILVLQDMIYTYGGKELPLSISMNNDNMIEVSVQMIDSDFVLPEMLAKIEQEAFERVEATAIEIPSSVSIIEANAFAFCPNLCQIRITGNMTKIDTTAFLGVEGLRIIAPNGSSAESFARENNILFIADD